MQTTVVFLCISIVLVVCVVCFVCWRRKGPSRRPRRRPAGVDYVPYLRSVYPALDLSRQPEEYARLYNSLGWYYQCCNANHSYVHCDAAKKWYVSAPPVRGPAGEAADILRYPAASNPRDVQWNAMKCCRYSEYRLPAVPTGHLYDWYSFQYFNVPTITVTADGYHFAGKTPIEGNLRDVSTFASQSPGTSFQGLKYEASELCPVARDAPRTAVVTADDPMATAHGVPVGLWAGPGPFYAGGRAIMRAMYYPNGPQYDPDTKRWTLNGEDDASVWLTSYLTKGRMERTTEVDFNTGRQWCNGFDEGDHVEIGHVQQIPGMPASTGYWYNYFGGGGTGVFHRYGRTPKVSEPEVKAMRNCLPRTTPSPPVIDIEHVSPRNKAHVLFTLLWEVRKTDKLAHPAGASAANVEPTTNGRELLEKLYGTSDPWQITMWYANGYVGVDTEGQIVDNDWTRYDASSRPRGKPCPDFNGFSDPLVWAQPSWLGGYGPNQKLISRQVDTAFALSIPALGAYTLPPPAPGNVSLHNLYGVMDDPDSGVTFATLCAFLLQAEFGPDNDELNEYVSPPEKRTEADGSTTFNTLPNLMGEQFPEGDDPVGVGALTKRGVQYALTKVFMGNYFYDRVANGVSFDEPMNYFALVLGYDDLQMTCNTNTNGVWSYENVYVGLPREEELDCDAWAYTWRKTVVETRMYPYITHGVYQSPAAAILNQLFASTNSARDPFDTDRDSAVLPCHTLGGFDCANSPDMRCHQVATLEDSQWGPYQDDVHLGLCEAEANAGTDGATSSYVLWDARDRCHHPWSQQFFEELPGASTAQKMTYMSSFSGMGHSFCQAQGERPSLSSIWGNVPYGGRGYGTGLVPLYDGGTRRGLLFGAGAGGETERLPTFRSGGPLLRPRMDVDPRTLLE